MSIKVNGTNIERVLVNNRDMDLVKVGNTIVFDKRPNNLIVTYDYNNKPFSTFVHYKTVKFDKAIQDTTPYYVMIVASKKADTRGPAPFYDPQVTATWKIYLKGPFYANTTASQTIDINLTSKEASMTFISLWKGGTVSGIDSATISAYRGSNNSLEAAVVTSFEKYIPNVASSTFEKPSRQGTLSNVQVTAYIGSGRGQTYRFTYAGETSSIGLPKKTAATLSDAKIPSVTGSNKTFLLRNDHKHRRAELSFDLTDEYGIGFNLVEV